MAVPFSLLGMCVGGLKQGFGSSFFLSWHVCGWVETVQGIVLLEVLWTVVFQEAEGENTITADGHTTSNAPDLFRPPKLSGVGPGQY